jgi:uncharacterized protein YlaN (UPF0358 family)
MSNVINKYIHLNKSDAEKIIKYLSKAQNKLIKCSTKERVLNSIIDTISTSIDSSAKKKIKSPSMETKKILKEIDKAIINNGKKTTTTTTINAVNAQVDTKTDYFIQSITPLSHNTTI